MGRHGQPEQRARVPWELVGWGFFALLVGAGCVVWFDGSRRTAGLVAGAGLLALVAVVAVAVGGGPSRNPPPGSSRRRRRPPP